MEVAAALRSGVDRVGVLRVPGEVGVVDDARRVVVEEMVRSKSTLASWGEGRVRLEFSLAAVTSGVDGVDDLRGFRPKQKHQSMRMSEGGRLMAKIERRGVRSHRKTRILPATEADSGEQIRGSLTAWRGAEWGKERGEGGGLYRGGRRKNRGR